MCPLPPCLPAFKERLYSELQSVQPNGLNASPTDQQRIADLIAKLETMNPTPTPSRSPLMAGFWRMLYTDMEPAPSSGKLGPFIGDVFQNLCPDENRIYNLLKVYPRAANVMRGKTSNAVGWSHDLL